MMSPFSLMAADHPRSRGVYPPLCLVIARRVGSSPLARGLPIDNKFADYTNGIIPARAGFTSWTGRYEDDPSGSSPLARGLRGQEHDVVGEPRIIPARAGFT